MRYQLPLVIAGWAGALSACAIIPLVTGNVSLYTITLWGGLVVGYFGYYTSLRPAREYGITLRASFDVYRSLLSESWPALEDVQGDRARFHRLREFVVTGKLIQGRGEELPEVAEEETGADEDNSVPKRAPRFWRPRLSLILLLIWFAIWGLGWRIIDLRQNDYLETTRSVDAYSSLAPSMRQKTRPHRHLSAGAIPVSMLGRNLISTRPLKKGVILTRDDVVETKEQPVRWLHLPAGAAEIQQLAIGPGSMVTLLLSGPADFKSNPECLTAHGESTPRLVEGEVASVVPISTTERSIILGVTSTAEAPIACYGATQTSIARQP